MAVRLQCHRYDRAQGGAQASFNMEGDDRLITVYCIQPRIFCSVQIAWKFSESSLNAYEQPAGYAWPVLLLDCVFDAKYAQGATATVVIMA